MSAAKQVDAIREAQHGKVSTRVPGHSMTGQGKVLDKAGFWPTREKVGSTQCECGERSPELDSNMKRRAWHRQHKLDVLSS